MKTTASKLTRRSAVVAIIAPIVTGCAAPKILSTAKTSGGKVAVSNIALSPDGGIVADAVGASLAAMGFGIVDAGQSGNLVARSGLDEAEISTSRGLRELRAAGVDAVLKVRTTSSGNNRIKFVTAQIFDTRSRKLIASTSWQNSRSYTRGGLPSLFTNVLQLDIVEIGDAIAKELSKSIRYEAKQ